MKADYTEAFKALMVKRMTGPQAMSATALSREVGVSQSSLSKWLRQAQKSSPFRFPAEPTKEPKMAVPPDKRSPQEKMRLVLEADKLNDDQLGAFLRREGIHSDHLERWKHEMLDGLSPSGGSRQHLRQLKRDNTRLSKELERKDKALAEAAALIMLKKKVQQMWGDEDESS